jgi:hypothetical protein
MPREEPPSPDAFLAAWVAWFIRRFVARPMEDARKLWLRRAHKDDLADDLP